MADKSIDEKSYYLWVLLRQAREACLRVRQKELDEYGIPAGQSAILIVIKSLGEGSTIGEIARGITREPHSVSSIINRMEKAGLVYRVRDPNLKSLVRVYLTEKGQKNYNSAIKRQSVFDIISVLTPEQRKQMEQYLRLVRDKALERLGTHEKPEYPPFDH